MYRGAQNSLLVSPEIGQLSLPSAPGFTKFGAMRGTHERAQVGLAPPSAKESVSGFQTFNGRSAREGREPVSGVGQEGGETSRMTQPRPADRPLTPALFSDSAASLSGCT